MNTTQAPNTPIYTEAELLEEITQLDIHSSESYEVAKKLLTISSEFDSPLPTIRCYSALGFIDTLKAEYHSARTSFSKALILFEEIKESSSLSKLQKQKLKLRIEGGIGNTYAFQTFLDLALPHYYKALKIAEKIKDTQQICNYLSNIGAIHVKNHDVDKGLSYFVRAKDVMLKENIHWHLDTMYSNIASCFFEKEDKEGVLKYLEKALKIASINKNKD
ncbi:MAG: tetratricopeptide repeat protein [Chitinophagales bacterium]